MRWEKLEKVLATVVDISALELRNAEQFPRFEVSRLQRQRTFEELDRELEVGLRKKNMRLVCMSADDIRSSAWSSLHDNDRSWYHHTALRSTRQVCSPMIAGTSVTLDDSGADFVGADRFVFPFLTLTIVFVSVVVDVQTTS